jgi:CRISPR/Cas system-associated exonuclease Cas4 (RecB family)
LLAAGAIALIEAVTIAWLLSGGGAVSPDRGELVVQSRPVAARVTIDGEERGITPYTSELSPGSHVLEVRVGRSEPRVIPLMIRGGMQTSLYVELQSVATVGGLEVRTEPANARVTISGQNRGVTPLVLRDLPPGEMEVVVRLGSREVRQTVRIEPGITSQLVVPMGR